MGYAVLSYNHHDGHNTCVLTFLMSRLFRGLISVTDLFHNYHAGILTVLMLRTSVVCPRRTF